MLSLRWQWRSTVPDPKEMTAAEFASLLRARKVGKERWSALCPAHGDRHRSLSIAVGRKWPIVFQCRSQHCPPEIILSAIGLTWQDLLEKSPVTPEIRERLLNQKKLERMERRWIAATLNKFWDSRNRNYWTTVSQNLDEQIEALRCKIDPQLQRERKMKAAIERHGWDVIWEKFLATPKGKSVSERWGI